MKVNISEHDAVQRLCGFGLVSWALMKMRSAIMKAQLMAPTMCPLQFAPYSVLNRSKLPACPFIIRKEGSDICDWALRRLSRTGCCCWRRW